MVSDRLLPRNYIHLRSKSIKSSRTPLGPINPENKSVPINFKNQDTGNLIGNLIVAAVNAAITKAETDP